MPVSARNDGVLGWIEAGLFRARYLLVLVYCFMTLGLAAFIIKQSVDIWHFIINIGAASADEIVTNMLTMLDNVMLANVVYLIICGSYLVYVKDPLSDRAFRNASERPQALKHLSPTNLKEKMAASLVGVSSVLMTKLIVGLVADDGPVHWDRLGGAIAVHAILIVGFLAFSWATAKEEEHEKESSRGSASDHSSSVAE